MSATGNPPILQVRSASIVALLPEVALRIETYAPVALQFTFTHEQMRKLIEDYIIAGGKIHAAQPEAQG